MRTANSSAAIDGDDRGDIDLTPMLDVVFIMLIFFIVTATFVRESGISVDRPESNDKPVAQANAILVAIGGDNSIWIERRNIDARAVRAVLERLHAESPASTVVVQANPKSDTDTLVRVLDASRQAGIFDIGIADTSN